MKKWLLKIWWCKLWGWHEWTSKTQCIPIPKNKLTIEGFCEWATMYCDRCGHVSEISKEFTQEILVNDLLKQTGVCKSSELKLER